VEAYGAERLVPGSDFLILLSFESYRTTFDHIRCCSLAPDDADRILYANAPALLGSS
jgi:hypothetical protein